jgi:hypothetical protein
LGKIRKIRDHGVEFRSHLDGSPIFLGPKESMEIQRTLGSDIAMVFDECPPHTADRDEVNRAVKRTLRWAAECKAQPRAEGQLVFGIVQGTHHADLRKKCAEALQKMGPGLITANTPIEKVFKLVHALDQQQLSPPLSQKYQKLVDMAHDAIQATSKGSSNKQQAAGFNPAHCITVVQKAHKVRDQLRNKLATSFPNLDKFQKRVLHVAVEQAAADIAIAVPLDPEPGDQNTWLKQTSGCPSDWLAEQVVKAQEKALNEMSEVEKKAELKGDDKDNPLMSHVFKNSDQDAMSKDLPEDSEAFAVVKQKLILSTKGAVVHGKPWSKPWSELSTTKFRHGDWDGRKPGVKGFNKFAQEMMERHNVPATKVVSVPHDGKPCVQPYQQVVAYLAHPKSYTLDQKCVDPYTGRQSCTNPSQRMLVVHRTGAGKTCSMIRVADNFFKDKRPKILLFPSPAV